MKTWGGEMRGLWLGLVAVAMFSLNLPFTRVAAQELDPLFIGLARSLLAAMLAGWMLLADGGLRPVGREWRQLVLCSAALVFGCLFFPFAMREVSAAHGAVIIGIQPLLTALAACWRNGERPSPAFWLCAVLGSLAVVAFAVRNGSGGGLTRADLAMLCAGAFCALGYAEGGRLAQRLGGWRTICWAMALSGPWLLPATLWVGWERGVAASPQAWGGVLYVSVFGLLIGTYLWYAGMAAASVARVGQMQLLQPFLTLAVAALLFGEEVSPEFWLFAVLLTLIVWLGRKMPVRKLQENNA